MGDTEKEHKWYRQSKAAEQVALAHPISEYDARGLLYCLGELLDEGLRFTDIIRRLCLNGQTTTLYCRNFKENDYIGEELRPKP